MHAIQPQARSLRLLIRQEPRSEFVPVDFFVNGPKNGKE
jgi:hypothetical protein